MPAIRRAVLVYQAGIANVFQVEHFEASPFVGRDATRLLQSDFRTCESFCRGLEAAGVEVRSAHCNRAGDVRDQWWSADVDDAPFRESMRPVGGRIREPLDNPANA